MTRATDGESFDVTVCVYSLIKPRASYMIFEVSVVTVTEWVWV